ncbi:MAG TPA: extracellular solute-binding protein [Fimbriimonadaceae bacterium]|nr:extracellular solute-binding protein [Fimbriimonadaceae bacterium]
MRSALAVLLLLLASVAAGQEPITIRMMAGPAMGIPPKEAIDPRSQARRAVFEEFHRQNPGIKVVNAGGLEMVGERAESMFLMSMAGDTAPDVFYVNFRQYYNYIDQGFCRPLDDLIARDPASIKRVNPIVMRVLKSYDGKIYSIPWFQVALGLYYRKDHFIEAGLDPAKPPRNWEEFYRYAQRLSEVKQGRTGFAFSKGPGYHWKEFLWQAGGEVVTPAERGYSKAAVATEGGVKAVEFFRKLVNDKWKGKDGKEYGPAASLPTDFGADVREGKTSMWFSYTNDVVLNMSDIPPALLGVAAMPEGPAGKSNEINAGMWAINATVTDPKKIEACWKFIKFFSGEEAARVNTQRFVELGLGNLVSPDWLKRFGYEDLAAQVDPGYVAANENLFKYGHPEPYGRNTQQVYLLLDNALERARLEPTTPAMTILKDISKEMDQKLLGYTPMAVLQQQRARAAGILVAVTVALIVLSVFLIRRSRRFRAEFIERIPAGTRRHRIYSFMLACLLPAGLSILVWAYYPLARGLMMAFQDYRIVKGTKWVGLDNFIAVFTQPIFYKSLWNSFVYVGLTLVIGFFIPIFLALALNEIPRAKVFFRTVFYLPAMTSPIIIAFLWRQFYDKTETGLLNSLLAKPIEWINPLVTAVGWEPIRATHDWLGDPTLAMFAVVLPGIWAGAGPGSILYLAALKNIPDERYEAADMDGATWWHKIRWITIPGIKPLILINLLGVFIAGFKAMENIFVLTGGGPLYATHTVGLEVWTNAFMFLRFGYATAAAWVMGAILIGFTLIQIQSLLKMRFSTAKV